MSYSGILSLHQDTEIGGQMEFEYLIIDYQWFIIFSYVLSSINMTFSVYVLFSKFSTPEDEYPTYLVLGLLYVMPLIKHKCKRIMDKDWDF